MCLHSGRPSAFEVCTSVYTGVAVGDVNRRNGMKKKMTDAAIDANRRNAAKSTGPKTFTNTRNNAVKHGLLAKALVFHTEEEKKEFDHLMAEICRYFQPSGWMESALVEELGVTYWL